MTCSFAPRTDILYSDGLDQQKAITGILLSRRFAQLFADFL